MERQPKVSVCIPVYNRPVYVAETIESVLCQTFTDFEIIITDNCSTDNTPEVIKNYAAKDNRVKYYRNQRNITSNINMAMLLSRGEYIKPLFSDDKLSPKCLELFADILDNHPKVSLVTSYTQSFGDDDHIRDESYFPGTGELDGTFAQKNLLINGNWAGSPSSVMFRRKDLHIGLSQNQWYWVGDLEMAMRLLGVGNAFVVPEILSYLRIHDQQESSIHAVDFRLIRERLMLTNIAFWFPHGYGEFTKAEQKAIHRHLLKRLVREGIGTRGLKPKVDMIKIGMSRLCYNRIVFFWTLIENLRRLFRKSRWS